MVEPLSATKSLDAQLRHYPLKNTSFSVIKDIVNAKEEAEKEVKKEAEKEAEKEANKHGSTSLYDRYTYGC